MEIFPDPHTETLPVPDCPPEQIDDHRIRALRFMQLGDEAYNQNAFEKARKYYQQAIRAHRSAADAATLQSRSELADCYYSLASLTDVLNELDEAEKGLKSCLSLLQGIVAETGSLHTRRKVWFICTDLSGIARRQEDYGKAMTYGQQALELAQMLEQETNRLTESRMVAMSRFSLAETASAQGDHSSAEEHYRHALDSYLAIAQTDASEMSLRDLASAYYRLGDTAKEQGAFATAADCYRQWFEVSLELDRMLSNDPAKSHAAYHFKIALVSEGEEKAAHLQEALRLFTALHEADPTHPLYTYSLESVRRELDNL